MFVICLRLVSIQFSPAVTYVRVDSCDECFMNVC